MNKNYKIGEFAKKMGVTIGFLKHHEADGILTPHISPSGYRYYEFSQGMQALQCLRLQSIGFSSKEIAEMLNHSSSINVTEKVLQKQKELKEDIIYYQELLQYLEQTLSHSGSGQENASSIGSAPCENWSIQIPEPFYYLENSVEGEFLPDPDNQLYDVICSWNRYMPMTSLAYFLQTTPSHDFPLDIRHWGMGLYISRKTGDTLNILKNDQVQLIQPGKSLIYHFTGERTRDKGHAHLREMLKQPLAICKEHNFEIQGDVYNLTTFASTANTTNYVHETLILPLKERK